MIAFLKLVTGGLAVGLVCTVPDVATYLLAAIVAVAIIAGPAGRKTDRP